MRNGSARRDLIWYSQIELVIQPWVSAAHVASACAGLQLKLCDQRPRAVSERSLKLFRFVIDVHLRQRNVSWSETMERWNTASPETTYADRRRFARDYRRAERLITQTYLEA